MRRILGVARQVLRVASPAESERAQGEARLLRLIRASLIASRGIYAAPRVLLDLSEREETDGKHRIAGAMGVNRLQALHGYCTRHISVSKPSALKPTGYNIGSQHRSQTRLGWRISPTFELCRVGRAFIGPLSRRSIRSWFWLQSRKPFHAGDPERP